MRYTNDEPSAHVNMHLYPLWICNDADTGYILVIETKENVEHVAHVSPNNNNNNNLHFIMHTEWAKAQRPITFILAVLCAGIYRSSNIIGKEVRMHIILRAHRTLLHHTIMHWIQNEIIFSYIRNIFHRIIDTTYGRAIYVCGGLWADEGQGIIKNKQFMALHTSFDTDKRRWAYAYNGIVIFRQAGRQSGRHVNILPWRHASMHMWHLLIVKFRLDWLFSYRIIIATRHTVSTRIHFLIFVVS